MGDDHRLDLYLLNVFTRDIIILPSMDSSLPGQARFERKEDECEDFIECTNKKRKTSSPVKTLACFCGDCVVARSHKQNSRFSWR